MKGIKPDTSFRGGLDTDFAIRRFTYLSIYIYIYIDRYKRIYGMVWYGLVWFVCMYVCMYACMHARMHACMLVICIYIYIFESVVFFFISYSFYCVLETCFVPRLYDILGNDQSTQRCES